MDQVLRGSFAFEDLLMILLELLGAGFLPQENLVLLRVSIQIEPQLDFIFDGVIYLPLLHIVVAVNDIVQLDRGLEGIGVQMGIVRGFFGDGDLVWFGDEGVLAERALIFVGGKYFRFLDHY